MSGFIAGLWERSRNWSSKVSYLDKLGFIGGRLPAVSGWLGRDINIGGTVRISDFTEVIAIFQNKNIYKTAILI